MTLGSDWRPYALASALFAALTAIFGKIGVSDVSADLATFYRTLIIVMLLALLLTIRHEWQSPGGWSVRSLAFLAASGLATGLSWMCYFRALKLGPASRVAPVDKLSVVFVVLIAAIFLGEKLTWKAGVGALLIACGAVIMAL